MTTLRKGDADLHHADGSHRSTPPTANGRVLERHERRLRAHLEEHAQTAGESEALVDFPADERA